MRANARSEWYRSLRPTHRELESLAHTLAFGRKNAGYRLGISEKTVTNLLTNLYTRLDVENASGAAISLGWLLIPSDYMTADVGCDSAKRPASAVDADILAEAVVHYVDAALRR